MNRMLQVQHCTWIDRWQNIKPLQLLYWENKLQVNGGQTLEDKASRPRPRPRPRFFVLEVSSRLRTVREDPIPAETRFRWLAGWDEWTTVGDRGRGGRRMSWHEHRHGGQVEDERLGLHARSGRRLQTHPRHLRRRRAARQQQILRRYRSARQQQIRQRLPLLSSARVGAAFNVDLRSAARSGRHRAIVWRAHLHRYFTLLLPE